MIGDRAGGYRIVREVARGGMGVVYEAVHEVIGHRAAVKTLARELAADPAHETYAQRFRTEARSVNRIDHPGVVKIFDFGTMADGTIFIVMEFLKGESLYARLLRIREETGGAMPLADVLRLGAQIASVLVAVHEQEIVHRDLKPENIILSPDPDMPGGERAKIIDFGIAKFLDSAERYTTAGVVLGTPLYMPPEQCEGSESLNERADVYALGTILFECLAGQAPFADAQDAYQLMYRHIHVAPPALAEQAAPQALRAMIQQMLAKRPAERPRMRDVAALFEQLGGQATRRAHAETVLLPAEAARGGLWGRLRSWLLRRGAAR